MAKLSERLETWCYSRRLLLKLLLLAQVQINVVFFTGQNKYLCYKKVIVCFMAKININHDCFLLLLLVLRDLNNRISHSSKIDLLHIVTQTGSTNYCNV